VKRMFSSPGMPNTTVTPSRSRQLTSRSATPGCSTATHQNLPADDAIRPGPGSSQDRDATYGRCPHRARRPVKPHRLAAALPGGRSAPPGRHSPRLPGANGCAGDTSWLHGEREPPYLHPSVTASVRFLGFTVVVTLVWGCLSMLPVPLIAAGFCEPGGRVIGARSARAAAPQAPLTRPPGSGSCPGGGGRKALVADMVQRVRAGGLSVRVTSCDGRRRGQEAASLT